MPNTLQMPVAVSAPEFFAAWKSVCQERKSNLLTAWESCPDYTAEIFDADDAVVLEIARELKLEVYTGYYSLDAIFFTNADRVYCAPKGQMWVQNICVAFEHENVFRSGLFQETSHLLITRAHLRVLVCYPPNETELRAELTKLAKIISQSDLVNSDPAFLLITGKLNNSGADIDWNAYIYQSSALLPLTI